jgi:chromosome partitioning protein
MRTIAIVNQKGGSGKTTTAVNLAAALAEKNRRVLLIDADPQASTSDWYGASDPGKAALDVFTGNRDLQSLIEETSTPRVSIVPASSWLFAADGALAGKHDAETILSRKIAPLRQLPAGLRPLPGSESTYKWNYILIDCAPNLGVLVLNAIAAAREVLVPVEAHAMALNGLRSVLGTVEAVKEHHAPELSIAGILACRVDGRTRHAVAVVDELRKRFGSQVYKTVIRENVKLAECPSFREPITQYDPASYGAEDYRSLAVEVLKQEPRYHGKN